MRKQPLLALVWLLVLCWTVPAFAKDAGTAATPEKKAVKREAPPARPDARKADADSDKEPAAREPAAREPDSRKEPAAREPAAREPAAREPAPREPDARKEPAAREPAAREPAAREPAAREPAQPVPAARPVVVAKPMAPQKLSKAQLKSMKNEQLMLWSVAVLLALGFVLFFLHFLLPFGALRFLGKLGYWLQILAFLGLLDLVVFRWWKHGQSPAHNLYTGVLWFALVALLAYFRKRRLHFSNVYLVGLPLNVVLLASLAWVTLMDFPIHGAAMASSAQAFSHAVGRFLMFTAFGFLATAGSWMLTSGFLGLLARRQRGTGYGLQPEQWAEFKLQTTSLSALAYPVLTLAWASLVWWSMRSFGSPFQAFWSEPRLWTTLFVWLMLSAYFFSLRVSRKEVEEDDFEAAEAVSYNGHGFGGAFLLFLGTLGGALLFYWASTIATFLQG